MRGSLGIGVQKARGFVFPRLFKASQLLSDLRGPNTPNSETAHTLVLEGGGADNEPQRRTQVAEGKSLLRAWFINPTT